ncbi:CC1-like family splicing factor [Spizellomyces punctatus DAOM BR117]|uniref:CC1-like family splicing factor n=1 Tax=Spizellomyces punctatus (strain DAOM BR117) TaxID=645134 RepID=A0A0L0HSY9_SPIPD|nr:CC1-like family splicing factor [Spizellomyces punctatus DAOM BR117]KND03989.1 CC1-like family splicing factor [Spizellomyces punctatus DAOM BR117]|eukprot:XP_016612028.1 CC1-like family splicing factor [Spizellomyces punctatus DAOM BR117]
MVMELDVEQLLEAPFRKEQAGPPQKPERAESEPTAVPLPSPEKPAEENRSSRGKEEKRRHRDRSRSRERDRRRSRSRSTDRKKRSRKDRSRSRSPRHKDDRDRRRRTRSRSQSPHRRTRHERPRSRSRDNHKRRRSSYERSRRGSGRDRSPVVTRSASPQLSEYERDKRTVFVMQLAARLTTGELFDFFAPAGKVRDARIIADRNSRRSKGVGYVEFYEEESVEKALQMTNQKLLGIPIIVQRTEAEKNRIAAEAEAAAKAELQSNRLYIGSLHFNLTEDDLKAVFEPFGAIDHINLHKDPDTGRSRGFAFVHYKNPADAKQAMEKMNGFEIMGRAIKVGHITDKLSGGVSSYSLDDGEIGGLSMNNVSRIDLMAKLARDELPIGGSALPAKPVILPTRNILLKNMFVLQEVQEEPDWDKELKDDVESECSKYGKLRHVGIDTESPDGRIYMKYNSIPEAEAAVNALNGRFFAGNRIEAAYVPDVTYNARFPEAAFE